MITIPIEVGDTVTLHRTVTEADLVNFAGVSGDFARNHVDEVYMAAGGRGGRIAHGALLVAWSSAASTRIAEKIPDDGDLAVVSLGYDRIRFLKPVRIGDTITIVYAIASVDCAAGRMTSAIEFFNQNHDLVGVATHVMKIVQRHHLFGG